MTLRATLTIGGALQQEATFLGEVGTSAACLVTFRDAVTLIETDPDGQATVGLLFDPSGGRSTLAFARVGVGQYKATPTFTDVGVWNVRATATQTVAMVVQEILVEGQPNIVDSYSSADDVPSSEQWIFVNASMSPYQANVAQPLIAVDLRQGPVTVNTWDPGESDRITVKDWYDLAATVPAGDGDPGGPITLNAFAGTALQDPAALGSYSASLTIATAGLVNTWRFSSQVSEWGIE